MNYVYGPSQHSSSKFEFSAEDINSDYRFLLRLVNTFTIDTTSITQFVTKLMMPRPLKTLYIILGLPIIICILQTGSFNWGL